MQDLDLRIEPGERVLLLGASGAGKSTLLHGLAGVLGGDEEGTETGRLLVDGMHPSRLRGQVGLVLQDPESQVVLARLGDDVAFGLENVGVPREEIWPRVRRALDRVGLRLPLDHDTSALSGGQKQRLALAGAVAVGAGLMLLDEPTANLDPQGIVEIRDAVSSVVADRSSTLIVVEHRVDIWWRVVDRVIVLAAGGGLLADGPPQQVFEDHRETLLAAGVWVPGAPLPQVEIPGNQSAGRDLDPRQSADALQQLLWTQDLGVGHGEIPVRQHLDLTIPAGRSTVITGANGSGKTTCALTLAGLLPRLGGEIHTGPELWPRQSRRRSELPRWMRRRESEAPTESDPGQWRSIDLLTRIGTVFQEPEHQFLTGSVADEIAVGLRALRWSDTAIQQRTEELLSLLHLEKLAGANPFSLSGGEKRRLSVGTVLATGPRIIFLDEPTFGQDRRTWTDLVRLVAGMLAEDRAVVSVTHDEPFIELLGQHRIHLEDQR